MSELHTLTATELVSLIRARKVSPVELVQASIRRAEALQPKLNCFITLCSDQALEQARQAEQAIMRGDAPGMLHGVPFTVKDIVNTAGVRTTFGTVFHEHHVPSEDAVSVARMKAAGAILLGKTTTPEFGSQPFTRSPLFGDTRNAWHADRSAGGSSGGAAVATAAGITALAVATDGGGSTRIPAACNGVVGIKQSNGVVPHSQAQDLFGNQTYVTPTSRTVADTGLMLQVMAGTWHNDPWSARAVDADYALAARSPGSLKGKRVRYCYAPENRPIAAAVKQNFDATLQLLHDLGAVVEPFDGQGFLVESIWRTINHTVWRARFKALVEQRPEAFSETFRQQVLSAQEFSAFDYQEAMFARSALFKRLQGLFETADLFVTPTLTRTALPLTMSLFDPLDIDGVSYEGLRSHWFPWTMVFNMTGHPAMSLPNGFDDEGLPTAVQFTTAFGADEALLSFGALFEQAHGVAPMPDFPVA